METADKIMTNRRRCDGCREELVAIPIACSYCHVRMRFRSTDCWIVPS